jgi:hypothetical protein
MQAKDDLHLVRRQARNARLGILRLAESIFDQIRKARVARGRLVSTLKLERSRTCICRESPFSVVNPKSGYHVGIQIDF